MLQRKPLRILRCTDARRERIARILLGVRHRAALHAIGWPPAAFRIDIAIAVAIVLRIGIDQATERAMFLRKLRFQSAPTAAVTGDDDLAAHVDATPCERLVIVGHAVVGVDQFGGDIAIAAIDVVQQQRAIERRRSIAGHRRLDEPGCVRVRCDQLQRCLLRRWLQHAEGFDARVPAPCAELREHELGVRLVVRRTDMIRLR